MDAAQSIAPAASEAAARPFRHVLCAVDGTRSSLAAVQQATEVAGPEAKLTLLAVTAPRGAGRFRSAALGGLHARRAIERAVRIADRSGVYCDHVIDPGGPPAAVIAEYAQDHDLLAMGAPADTKLGPLGATVATETLRTFMTPLLLARQQPAIVTSAILLASDDSEASDLLVALASSLAGGRCERIVLLHAQGRGGPESEAHPRRIDAQRKLLERAYGKRLQTIVESRDASELIETAAKEHACTLAMLGSRRRNSISALLGGVSRRAVRALRCSMLMVPPARLPRAHLTATRSTS
jgi:nucleotide-binding universal stress UspA family protein